MLIPLTSGAYESRSVLANAQRCVNLMPEANPTETTPPVAVTHYPTPGLRVLATPTTPAAGRGLWRATDGQLYAAIGDTLYVVSSAWDLTALGTIAAGTDPVSMTDNETTLVLVDGTTSGYTVTLATNAFAAISDPDFRGSRRVDFLNTYFLLSVPDTPQFYTSLSNTVSFDALYFANLTGQPTDLVAPVALHGNVWLLGATASEIWFNTGDTALLPFQRQPDMVLHHGCKAAHSPAVMAGDDDSQTAIYWLGANRDGDAIILRGQGYAASRVSTFAIEDAIRKYPRLDDAVGYCYQQGGHSFYVLSFPTADKTWCYDATTGQFHERVWLDADGREHRHRAQCAARAYGETVALDWETGALYALDLDCYTDADQPIKRLRSFPHLTRELNRVIYARFVADVEVGTDDGSVDGSDQEHPPLISLRWSDDRGVSWGNAVTRSLGAAGQYAATPMWTQLGMARDRVFELSWSVPTSTALNGAYVEPIALAT